MTNLMPATPTRVEQWIIQAIKEGPCKRSELLQRVGVMAKEEGFSVTQNALKIALANLARLGDAVQVQWGWWGLPGWNKRVRAGS